jgi:curli production assembly/transport component CsgF
MIRRAWLGASLVSAVLSTGTVGASEQVYRPVNPLFGGNPLNGTFILQQAQAQGLGAKSGQQQSPDLSGLNEALGNIGNVANQTPIVVIGGNGLPVVPASP